MGRLRGTWIPLSFALTGGEDYELAFAVSPRMRRQFLATTRRARDLQVTRIGRFVPERGRLARHGDALTPLPGGFQHWEDGALFHKTGLKVDRAR